MVAASHMPVTVWTALLVRIAMGSIVRWKTSHRIAMPSTADDCGAHQTCIGMGQQMARVRSA